MNEKGEEEWNMFHSCLIDIAMRKILIGAIYSLQLLLIITNNHSTILSIRVSFTNWRAPREILGLPPLRLQE